MSRRWDVPPAATKAAERFRGAPRLNHHPETGEPPCITCHLCALVCPKNLMVVGWKPTADRKKKLTTLTHDLSQFMLYKLHEHACPADALELTQNFEFAYCKWEGAVWGRKIPEDGPQPIGYSR